MSEEEEEKQEQRAESRGEEEVMNLLLKYCRLPCPSEARNEVKSEGGPTD